MEGEEAQKQKTFKQTKHKTCSEVPATIRGRDLPVTPHSCPPGPPGLSLQYDASLWATPHGRLRPPCGHRDTPQVCIPVCLPCRQTVPGGDPRGPGPSTFPPLGWLPPPSPSLLPAPSLLPMNPKNWKPEGPKEELSPARGCENSARGSLPAQLSSLSPARLSWSLTSFPGRPPRRGRGRASTGCCTATQPSSQVPAEAGRPVHAPQEGSK